MVNDVLIQIQVSVVDGRRWWSQTDGMLMEKLHNGVTHVWGCGDVFVDMGWASDG